VTELTIADSTRMPVSGPEVLDLTFRLGALTVEQLRNLLVKPLSARRTREALAALRKGPHDRPLIATSRRYYPYAQASGETGRWLGVHYLTDSGIRYVAARRALYPATARSLYSRVLTDATVDHALLRNEFYALFASALRSTRDGDESGAASDWCGLGLETMCGESGYTPILLHQHSEKTSQEASGPNPGKKRRLYLNPDGVLEVNRKGDPGFHAYYFIESDTGSQDMPWQIARKAEHYAEHFADLLALGRPIPKVLFVSPTVERTRWVRQVIYLNALEKSTRFFKTRSLFEKRGLSLASKVVFTNLIWQRAHGPLGTSYWSLVSNERERPF
jgi:hypothetical protein